MTGFRAARVVAMSRRQKPIDHSDEENLSCSTRQVTFSHPWVSKRLGVSASFSSRAWFDAGHIREGGVEARVWRLMNAALQHQVAAS